MKAPFSIATAPRCRGRYSFPGLIYFTLDPYLIMLSVKQGGIKYHFLNLWYDSTWDWTQVSRVNGEHSHIYIYIYIYIFNSWNIVCNPVFSAVFCKTTMIRQLRRWNESKIRKNSDKKLLGFRLCEVVSVWVYVVCVRMRICVIVTYGCVFSWC